MAIRIKARGGESAEQIMRRFKKLCEKEGLTKEIKRRAYYEKPSERKQRALRKTLKRIQQQQAMKAAGRPTGRVTGRANGRVTGGRAGGQSGGRAGGQSGGRRR